MISLSRLVPLVIACCSIFACGGNGRSGYAIAGDVKGCSTATVRLSGSATRAATTGVDGTFVFDDVPEGSYTVTPELVNCTFTPASRTIVVHGGNAGSQDFVGLPTASWTTAGEMSHPRAEHTATLLADGRVLVAGGEPSGSAEIFDPVSNGFSPTGALGTPRVEHVAVLLADGRVLVAGGLAFVADGSMQETPSAEIYDPGTGRFSPTGPMNRTRLVPGAVRLSDGRVLVAGGESNATAGVFFLDDAELYDPVTGRFTAAGAMATVSGRVALNLLTENLVLAVGEQGSADLYAPGGSFAATDPLPIRRGGSTAVPIGGSKVFVAGGTGLLADAGTAVYSYSLNHFQSGPLLLHPRTGHVMAPLPGGRALLAAGMQEGGETLLECEVCSPSEGICTATGALAQGRDHTAAVALADGRVLVVGGNWIGPGALGGVLATAEIYRPAAVAP